MKKIKKIKIDKNIEQIELPLFIGLEKREGKVTSICLIVPIDNNGTRLAIPLNAYDLIEYYSSLPRERKDMLEDPEMVLMSLTDNLKDYFNKEKR